MATASPAAHKVHASTADTGDHGQQLLVKGEHVALRRWAEQPGDAADKSSHQHDYETVGYVVQGRAQVLVDGETLTLEPGDSWLIPSGASHTYTILEPFVAIEATTPPARDA